MKLRRNDKVIMTVGRDKGKAGKVLRIIPGTEQVLVEGIGIVKRHTKPSTKNPRGGILDVTKPVSAAKVSLVCPHCNKPTRVGYILRGDRKERICRKCQSEIKS